MLIHPPALAVGRGGHSEAEAGVGGYRLLSLRRHPPPDTSFASLTRCHPPHRERGGRDKESLAKIYRDTCADTASQRPFCRAQQSV
jgi:hypothetical protein